MDAAPALAPIDPPAANAVKPPALPPIPARRSKRAWVLLGVAVLLALAADLWSKHAAFERIAAAPVVVVRDEVLAIAKVDPSAISRVIPSHPPVMIVPHLLEFQLVLNSGAVFGMGQGQRWSFMVFTTIAIGAALLVFAYWTRAKDRWAHLAIGLLIAGGIGNFYDRMVYGAVRDFLHPLPGVSWPMGWMLMGRREIWPYVSNVADAFLLVGIGMLAIYLWRNDPKRMHGPNGLNPTGSAR